MIRVIVAMLSAAIALNGTGATIVWNDSTGDHKWGTKENWSLERLPEDGDNVTIPENKHAITVDDDSAASFASAMTITQRAVMPITYIDIEATTNLTLRCVMATYASFRLKSPIDMCVVTNWHGNFKGFNVLEKGRFLMPDVMCVGDKRSAYNYGRFSVSNDAALVARCGCLHSFYALWVDGMVTNSQSAKATVTVDASTPCSYIAGPIGGYWAISPASDLNIVGTNNVALTGEISPYNRATLGIMKFGVKGSKNSSIGDLNLTPSNYGSGIRYLGDGETTDKDTTISQSTTYEQTLDGGPVGGLVWNGKLSYKTAYKSEMHRFVFAGAGTAKTNVFAGAWDALNAGFSTYVTKTGPSTWRFNENSSRNNAGVVAVEEGTLQFESIKEKGLVCSLGTADNLNERYSGDYDAGRTVDYAYLLGTTNATGASATEGTLEYVGSARGVSATRSLRLQGDGRLSSPASDLQLVGMEAVGGGDRTLRLSAGLGTSSSLDSLNDGDGRVSVVKDGPGTWTIGGTSSVSGSIDVREGELRVIGLGAPYEYYRFSIMGTASGETNTYQYCYTANMDELALFDDEGTRLNPSMAWRHESHEKAGNYPVSGDARELEPNELFAGRTDSMFFYADNKYGLDLLCNGKAATKATECPHLIARQSNAMAPQLTKPETYIPIVMRVAASAIGQASRYDFLSDWGDRIPGTSTNSLPTSFKLEGSPDGASWTELSRREHVVTPATKSTWYSDGTTFSASVAPTGFEISKATTAGFSVESAASVSVAAGATLRAVGDAGEIARLSVDAAAGAGTLDGFELAEEGTLSIAGEPADAQSYEISLSLANCTTASRLSGWAIMVDGVDLTSKRVVSVADGKITVSRRGLLMIVR